LAAVAFYISGHGFGHASRQIEIVNALGALRPDLRILLRTSAAPWLVERTARVPVTLVAGDCDTGVVQHDSLRLDAAATIRNAAAFHRALPRRAADEAALLRQQDVRFVVVDAPPLGCAAAAAAGVPAAVVGNFTWDWIYEEYAEELPAAPDLLPAIRQAYSACGVAWRLPMHGGFATFDTIDDFPFVARHAVRGREEVRRLLRLPEDLPLVLSSFGGYGVDGLDLDRLDCLDAYGLLVTRRDGDRVAPSPRGVYPVAESEVYGHGLRYEDLVAACDVVATKPGYGIIAECIANQTAIMYTSRGRFAEYPVMVEQMPRYLRCGYLDHDDLFGGRWRSVLDRIMAAPAAAERAATDGADLIARRLGDRV
jgi:L-arabinokinase